MLDIYSGKDKVFLSLTRSQQIAIEYQVGILINTFKDSSLSTKETFNKYCEQIAKNPRKKLQAYKFYIKACQDFKDNNSKFSSSLYEKQNTLSIKEKIKKFLMKMF